MSTPLDTANLTRAEVDTLKTKAPAPRSPVCLCGHAKASHGGGVRGCKWSHAGAWCGCESYRPKPPKEPRMPKVSP